MAVQAGAVGRAVAVPLLAGALLAAGAGCTGSPGSGDAKSDAPHTGPSPSGPPAPPGKFRTLPEPCGAVGEDTLRRLLPSTEDRGGRPTATYDTDRRAGCEWNGESDTWNRYLHVDFERVVSYDPSISDEEQAQDDYLTLATDADVPSSGASGSTPASAPPSSSSSGPGSGSGSGESESPHVIGGIGDEAFLDDEMKTDDAEPHRDITLVFRKANVIVRVEYQQWPLDGTQTPASGPLRLDAHRLAQELSGILGDG